MDHTMMSNLLGIFFERHYVPVRLLGRAEATVADMRSFVRTWDATMGPVAIEAIDLQTAANFLRAMRKSKSPATCNKYRSYLLTLLREAKRMRLVKAPWLRRLPKMPVAMELPVAWTREQAEALLRAAAQEPGEICGVPAGKWWVCLGLISLNTALRIRAALSIKTADVDMDRGFLIVRGGRQKNRVGQFFPLPARVLDAIWAIWEPARVWLLPWPGCQVTLKRHFARICKLVGVPAGGHSGYFHRGRCTAISHAWAVSPELARQMAGHASIETTRKHYVDPRVAAPAPGKAIAIF